MVVYTSPMSWKKKTDLSVVVNRLTAPLLQSFLIFFGLFAKSRKKPKVKA